VLEAWRGIAASGALLVLVPRHPQRFAEVAALLTRLGIDFVRRSDSLPGPETQVWLGDSMGEMAAYYALADIAFAPGSQLLSSMQKEVADLMRWHAAEEIEHKSVAFDVWAAVDGSRWRYARAGALSIALLAWLVLWSIALQMHSEHRLRSPATWWRTGRLLVSADGRTFNPVAGADLQRLGEQWFRFEPCDHIESRSIFY
jgi:hypothetical protein